MFLYQVALFSTCLGRTLALSPPPVEPIQIIAADSTLSAANSSLGGASKPDCSSNFYGEYLNVASCNEALDLMQYYYNARTYVKRNTPQPQGNFPTLPDRWLSCKSENFSRDQRPI